MTNTEDARPFVDLKKDAEEFQLKFDEDIKECTDFLNAKITALICDPDSFGIQGRHVKQNTLVEFSKAKYDVFISVKSLINRKEKEWLEYISEMKKLFIENVEIFLAGTKLEVKLPPSESQPSLGTKKSPGNRKSTSTITSSIYPIINTLTKSIPVLGSSIQDKKDLNAVPEVISNVGDEIQFNRRGRLSSSSVKLAHFFSKEDEEEMDMEGSELNQSKSGSRPSSRSRKSNTSVLNTSQRSSSKIEIDCGLNQNISLLENELNSAASETVLPSKVRGRRGKMAEKNSNIENGLNQNTSLVENELNSAAPETVLPSKVRGRRGKMAEKNSSIENVLPKKVCGRRGKLAEKNSSIENVVDSSVTNSKLISGRQQSITSKKAVAQSSSSSSSDENTVKNSETNENEVHLTGRRGRSGLKDKANVSSGIAQSIYTSSADENEIHNTETNRNAMSLKGRRGRSAVKDKTDDLAVVVQNSSSADENEVQYTKKSQNKLKGPIGKSAAKVEEQKSSKTHRSKSAASQNTTNVPGTSKLSKKVAFIPDSSSSDELDIQTPLARPAKSTVRRKTLLPNLEDLSGADVIPGNSRKSKRKTIGGVSEFETLAPPKRLKVSSQRNISQEEDSAANDNLLESDGNYSEWMALKSVDGKIPTRPAVYELKVWRAKKSAYIGSCESLRQKLTLYKLRQNSGHKHLDKFIDRNYDDIQVRYEVVTSFADAKEEEKNRVKSFVGLHKNTPAYN